MSFAVIFGLLVSLTFSAAATLDIDLLKKTHAPLKRKVAGRTYDLASFIEWYVEDVALSGTPQVRKQRPQQFVDWELIYGVVLASTNGMTYMDSRRANRFIAVKNYPNKPKVGETVPILVFNLKYSRNDYVNQRPNTWAAFDFGTPVP